MTLQNDNQDREHPWWTVPEDEVHEVGTRMLKRLVDNDRGRIEYVHRMRSIYESADGGGSHAGHRKRKRISDSKPLRRSVKNGINAVHGRMTKNNPRPFALTDGGDFKMRRRAKKLNQYMSGQFEACNVYQISKDLALEAMYCGTGVAKIFDDGQSVHPCLEQVYCDELFIDPMESYYKSPRQLYQVQLRDKWQLIEDYP